MRLTIGKKMMTGYLLVLGLMAATMLYAVNVGQTLLEESVKKHSLLLAEELLERILFNLEHTFEHVQLTAQGMPMREAIAQSNSAFQALPDAQGYIDQRHAEWRAAPDDELTPFMQDLISNELSRRMQDKFISFWKNRQGYSLFGEIIITNRYGANIGQSGKTSGYDQSGKLWWQRANADGSYLGAVEYDDSAGMFVIPIAIRVDDEDGHGIGVVSAAVSLMAVIREAEVNIKTYETTELQVIAPAQGKLLYATRAFQIFEDVSGTPLFQHLQGKRGSFVLDEGQRTRVFSYVQTAGQHQEIDWVLVIGHDQGELLRPVSLLKQRIVLISVLCTLCGLGLALAISRSITKPVGTLIAGTEIVGRGDLDHQVLIRAHDEIGELAAAFNRMTEKRRQIESRLRLSEERLRQHRDHLDELVKERSYALGERMKELNCLYQVSQLMAGEDLPLDDLLKQIVTLIPPAWQYPERTCARIRFGGKIYQTECFQETVWKQAADISSDNETLGSIEVCYLQEYPVGDEGPFLREERELLATLGREIGRYVIRRQTGQQYRTVIQTATDGFWSCDSQGRLLDVNEALCHMLGYTREELLGMSIPEIEAAESPDEAAEHIRQVIRNGTDRFETRHLRKDGSQLDVEVSTTYLADGGGRFFVFARDISERKQAEEILQESETRFRLLAENSVDAIWQMDPKLTFTYVSPAIYPMTGYTPEEWIGSRLSQHASFKEFMQMARKALLALKNYKTFKSLLFEAVLLKKDGSSFSVEISGRLIYNKKGRPIGLQGTTRDITERKRAEERLARQHQQLLALLDGIDDVIYVSDPDTYELLHVNDKFIQHWGADAIGKICYTVLQDHDAPCSFCTNEKIFGENLGQVYVWEFQNEVTKRWYRCADKAIRWVDDRWVRFEQATDITEQKWAEMELKRLNNELAQKNRELEQIVYVASHDLRSPLVNVQGFSKELKYVLEDLRTLVDDDDVPQELRQKMTTMMEGEILEDLRYILSSIAKMDGLLSGLLKLSRLGRAALTLTSLDMNELIDQVASSFNFQLKEAGVRLEIAPLPPCRGDATQINQVFSNLVENALKYLDPERLGQIRIWGREDNEQKQVVYCVEDNGLGIAPEHQPKIFEIFHRLDPEQSEGEGLGLTIVRRILERHNGKIWVESTPGAGSTFYVALPGVFITPRKTSRKSEEENNERYR